MAIGPSKNTKNLYGSFSGLRFPQRGYYSESNNLGLVLRMQAFSFQNYHQMRAVNPGSPIADIVLPAPNQLLTNNSINYGFEESDTYWNVTPAWWNELMHAGNYIPIWKGWVDDQNQRRLIANSEAILKAPNLRSFTYSWNLVPKEPEDEEIIAIICKTLQTMAYPIQSISSREWSRWEMPPMWINSIIDVATGRKSFRWDMGPMPAAITTVAVNPTAGGGVYATGRFERSPIVTNLSITFVELDMAVGARAKGPNQNVPHLIPLSVARNKGIGNAYTIRSDIY